MPWSGEGNAVCELRDMAMYISQISEKKKSELAVCKWVLKREGKR